MRAARARRPRRAPDRSPRSCSSATPTRCSSAPTRAEAELAAAAGHRRRARRGSPRSSPWPLHLAAARDARRSRATRRGLRCELVEAEPEQSLPALALGDLDLVLGDEWQHQPRRAARRASSAHELLARPGLLVLPAAHPARAPPPRRRAARRARRRGLDGRPRRDGWEEMTQRTCRELGGFDPDIRHRTNDATISLALVARGQAVTLLPELVAARPRARASRCARSPRARAPDDLRRHARRRRRAPVDRGAPRRGPRRGCGPRLAGLGTVRTDWPQTCLPTSEREWSSRFRAGSALEP